MCIRDSHSIELLQLKITDILFSLAKRLGSNLTLIFALINFYQKNGLLQYSSWTHLGPSQILTVDHILTYYFHFLISTYSCGEKLFTLCNRLQSLCHFLRGLKWEFRPKETTCILSSIFALIFAERIGFYGTWTHIGPCKLNINKIMCKREFVRPEETTLLWVH